MRPHLVLAALLLAALSGCTSTTRLVDRADAEALARANAGLRGRAVAVRLQEGPRRVGRLRFVRPDSTVLDEQGRRQAWPTTAVAAIETTDFDASFIRGTLIGTAGGFAAGLWAARRASRDGGFGAVIIAPVVAITLTAGGLAVGAATGAAAGRRLSVVLVDAPASGAGE